MMAVHQPSLSEGYLMPSIRAYIQFTHKAAAEFGNFDQCSIFAEREVIARLLDWRSGIGTMCRRGECGFRAKSRGPHTSWLQGKHSK